MYVLPYGQMSLWGATVITNLMSAIPWIGQDIVEFIWGGLYNDEPHYSDIMLKILLNAGNSSKIEITYDLLFRIIIMLLLLNDIRENCNDTETISRGEEKKLDDDISSVSLASQRLHAGDLGYAYLVGFIEGDGFFSVSRNGLYVKYEFGVELSIKDVALVNKLKRLLGVGVISFRRRNDGSEMVSLRIRNKDHLKKIIIPIFDKYPMFSNKEYDYQFFKKCLDSNLIKSKDLVEYKRILEPSLNSVNSILNASYFEAWLVGFIEAEGCFSIYKSDKERENSLTASFDISQTNGNILISAIRQHLSFTTKIYIDKTNNSKLKVSSVRSIENIIKFLNKAPVKLLGNKRLQYLLWIKNLRQIKRYNDKINIPSIYSSYLY